MTQSKQKLHKFAFILIPVIGFSVYFNSLTGQFLWDDHHYVTNNATIKNWENLPKIFQHNIAYGSFSDRSVYYRPIQELTYLIDYHFWKLDVRGYHLTNIIWHILAALSFYWLVFRLSNNPLIAFTAGMLFIVHPIHAEAVNAIAGRGEQIAATFLLLTIIFYISGVEKGFKPRLFISVSTCYLLALLAKENSIIFLLLIGCYHFCFRKKIEAQKILPIFLSLGCYLLIRMFFVKTPVNLAAALEGGWQRIPGFFQAVVNYWQLIFFPHDLHFDYGQPIFSWLNPAVILGILVWLGMAIGAVLIRKKNPLISFSLSWIVIALMPYTNIYKLYSYMAEHHLYFPSCGMFILAGCVMHLKTQNQKTRQAGRIIMISFLASFALITVQQNRYWSNPFTFYERSLEYNPGNWIFYNNLGTEYSRVGSNEKELESYRKALELNPEYALTHRNLGVAYLDLRQYDLAQNHLEIAIQLEPDDTAAYSVLGVVENLRGNPQSAIHYLQIAIQKNPDFVWAYNNLGSVYYGLNDFLSARDQFFKALELDRFHIDANFNLGLTYLQMGDYSGAIRQMRKTIELDPHHEKARFFLTAWNQSPGL